MPPHFLVKRRARLYEYPFQKSNFTSRINEKRVKLEPSKN